MFQKEISLQNLVNLEDWQKIQDYLSEALEVTIRTISTDGELITRPSRQTHLSAEILPKVFSFHDFCQNRVLGKDAEDTSTIKEVANFPGDFGTDIFVVPITAVGNKTIAYVIMGPLILKARKDVSEYEIQAQSVGVSLEELVDALIEINVFSYSKVYSITKLLKETFSYIAQTGYHKKRLGEIAPEVIELDPLFSRYYEEKILNSLLNSCTLALDADSGSVMTLDKNTKMLHIKVASKLDEKIIKSANVKVGEGIAGIAAATSQTIILPKDEKKNGLFEKMNRKYIKSSMIVPFNKGSSSEVYGVLNLNVVRSDVDFSDRDIAIVKELVNLASVAMIPFQQ